MTRKWRALSFVSSILSSLLLLPASAIAQPAPAQPSEGLRNFGVPYVDRPLTLPAKTFALDAEVSTLGYPFGQMTALGFGADYGVIDDVTLSLRPISYEHDALDPPNQGQKTDKYASFFASVTGRLGHARWGEISTSLGFRFEAEEATAEIVPRLDVAFHLAHRVRIDAAVVLEIQPNEKGTISLGVKPGTPEMEPGLPLSLTVQLLKPLFVGLQTGLSLVNNRGYGYALGSLGADVGATVPYRGRPLLDALGTFDFPGLINGDLSQISASPQVWQVRGSIRTYLPI